MLRNRVHCCCLTNSMTYPDAAADVQRFRIPLKMLAVTKDSPGRSYVSLAPGRLEQPRNAGVPFSRSFHSLPAVAKKTAPAEKSCSDFFFCSKGDRALSCLKASGSRPEARSFLPVFSQSRFPKVAQSYASRRGSFFLLSRFCEESNQLARLCRPRRLQCPSVIFRRRERMQVAAKKGIPEAISSTRALR